MQIIVEDSLSQQAHRARSEGQGNWSKLCPEIGVLQRRQRCVFSVADQGTHVYQTFSSLSIASSHVLPCQLLYWASLILIMAHGLALKPQLNGPKLESLAHARVINFFFFFFFFFFTILN